MFEPSIDSIDETAANGAQMIPRLVKTYRGHSGYVHSIALLGTFDPLEQRRCQQESYLNEMDDNISFSSSPFSRHSYETKGFNHSNASLIKKIGWRKRDLFVTASRDNTLRIWELVTDEHDQYFDGSSETDCDGKKDPLRKGKKLRGHEFGVTGGVLCVCALPSMPSSHESSLDDGSNGGRLGCDGSNLEEDAMISAGQFVSGGSDGVLRVYDVKSALNLERVPRSGMYKTIQLQRLDPFSSKDTETVVRARITAPLVCQYGVEGVVVVEV